MTDHDTPNDEQVLRLSIVQAAHGAGMEIMGDEEFAGVVEAMERSVNGHDERARAEGRIFLDEENDRDVIDAWWKRAADCQSIEEAKAFAEELITKYRHDYGTICHAIAAAGYAMAMGVERSPEGHITGFQAGAVGWLFMRHWNMWGDEPRQLVDWSQLLYPQYDRHFGLISGSTARWLKERAAKNIQDAGDKAHPDVVARWREIEAGRFPSFVTVEAEEVEQ